MGKTAYCFDTFCNPFNKTSICRNVIFLVFAGIIGIGLVYGLLFGTGAVLGIIFGIDLETGYHYDVSELCQNHPNPDDFANHENCGRIGDGIKYALGPLLSILIWMAILLLFFLWGFLLYWPTRTLFGWNFFECR